jgi:hypothetical protein
VDTCVKENNRALNSSSRVSVVWNRKNALFTPGQSKVTSHFSLALELPALPAGLIKDEVTISSS